MLRAEEINIHIPPFGREFRSDEPQEMWQRHEEDKILQRKLGIAIIGREVSDIFRAVQAELALVSRGIGNTFKFNRANKTDDPDLSLEAAR